MVLCLKTRESRSLPGLTSFVFALLSSLSENSPMREFFLCLKYGKASRRSEFEKVIGVGLNRSGVEKGALVKHSESPYGSMRKEKERPIVCLKSSSP